MSYTMDDVKKLREMTSCGVIECKKALEESKGDFTKAKDVLQKRGLEIAAKKGDRAAKEGRLESYIHPGNKLAVLLEVNCETDFVARGEKFSEFCKDVAMHIAAMNPKYVRKEDVPADALINQNEKTFLEENCLMNQAFIKDPKLTIQDYLNTLIASMGENIFVRRFKRYKVGEVE